MLRGLAGSGPQCATLKKSQTERPMATYADSIMAQLAEVEAKTKELEALKESLRAELITEIKESNAKSFAGVYGKATICNRDSYIFSNEVVILEEQLKAQKAIEKKTGIATVSSSTEYVRITWN